MEVAMSKCNKESGDEHATRKEKEVDVFVFLPDDILSDIFKRLPDAFLRYKAKYVCRRWFKIITDTILLDNASFILQNLSGMYRVCHVDIRDDEQLGLQVKEEYLNTPYMGMIKSWYNEFFLIMRHPSLMHNTLYVLNIITNERSFLPNCPTPCGGHYSKRCEVALFFDKFKGVYKVVHLFLGPPIRCHILILERNSFSHVTPKWKTLPFTSTWKNIEVPSYMDFRGDPVAVQVQGRYFHWDVRSSNYLVSVDMVKEDCFQMSLPKISGDRRRIFYSFSDMGGFLTLIDGISMGIVDIWILKDFQMMKWEKLQSITFSDHYVRKYFGTSFLYPVCGVISKRYIIIMKSGEDKSMFSYDLKNGAMKELNIHLESNGRCVVHSSAPDFMFSG